MTNSTGHARFVGSAHGVVRQGRDVVDWYGEARLYHLDPPLRGYTTVVASTLPDAVRLAARGGVQRGVETFLWGVLGEDLQVDFDSELPGSGWGNALVDALAEAGYMPV